MLHTIISRKVYLTTISCYDITEIISTLSGRDITEIISTLSSRDIMESISNCNFTRYYHRNYIPPLHLIVILRKLYPTTTSYCDISGYYFTLWYYKK